MQVFISIEKASSWTLEYIVKGKLKMPTLSESLLVTNLRLAIPVFKTC